MRRLLGSLFATSLLMIAMAVPASAATTTSVLSISPTRLSFGKVAVGSTGWADVTISNSTSDDLALGSAGFTSGDGFSTDWSLSSCYWQGLPAGGSCTVRLTFTPTDVGGEVAQAHVVFMDPLTFDPLAPEWIFTDWVRIRGIGTPAS
jgi:hypothetical protein